MEKVIRNGMVAVLYSPGFGAGWYSWNERRVDCLFHPKIVEMVEKKEYISDTLCEELFGEDFYSGGAGNLKIEWMPLGFLFKVKEYDGSESIEIRDAADWIRA